MFIKELNAQGLRCRLFVQVTTAVEECDATEVDTCNTAGNRIPDFKNFEAKATLRTSN
jgi:hypothetical protein